MFNWGSGREEGSGDSLYNEKDPLLGITNELTYTDCLNIFKYWPLGVRIATALPNFALSVNRKILFEDFPKEVIDHFLETERALNVKNIIKNHCYNIRIFGSSCLFIQTDEDYDSAITMKTIQNAKSLRIIHATPLITSGSSINIDPLSPNYLYPTNVLILNRSVHLSRVIWTNNNEPMYLQWNSASFNYAGRSSYANMIDVIKYWNKATVALQRIASKAGGIIVKNREGGILNSIVVNSTNKFLDVIRKMTNDGIASINHGDDIELFNINGVSEVEIIINKFNEILQLALTDTPTAILLDERLAKGFGNGEEDFKALLIAVEAYRESILDHIYKKIDTIVMYRAFTDDFIRDLQSTYKSDFKNMSIDEIKNKLLDSFSYEWESLYPESEAVKQDNRGRKLDNLMKLKELGVTLSDIESIVNSDKDLFEQNLTFEEPEPLTEEDEDEIDMKPTKVNKPSGDLVEE